MVFDRDSLVCCSLSSLRKTCDILHSVTNSPFKAKQISPRQTNTIHLFILVIQGHHNKVCKLDTTPDPDKKTVLC